MFIDTLFSVLTELDDFFWGYIGFTALIAAGLYFTIKSNFYQFAVIARPIKTLLAIQMLSKDGKGLNPFRLYFASVGGMVGLGNIVGVVTAILIGGPGALFWLWIAAFAGMLIKYAEIYLGMKYRVPDGRGGYDGGPMLYLAEAFKSPFLKKAVPLLFCGLLVFYSVEVFQFVVVVDTISNTWNLDRTVVMLLFLGLCLYGGLGGIRRLANIASTLMPIFIVGYLGIAFYVVGIYVFSDPTSFVTMIQDVFVSAFTGHAATGGFVGSSLIMAIQMGTSRAVYSGDLGIGYDSIIQSESRAQSPEIQATLSIFGVLTDMVICTLSILVVLTTGVWTQGVSADQAISIAFAQHIPGADHFVALLLLVAGYSTLIAYLAVGNKILMRLGGRRGFWIYLIYSAVTFIAFSYLPQEKIYLLMTLSGGLLVITNLSGIWSLRSQISFNKLSISGLNNTRANKT